MWEKYNPNPLSKLVGDCVIRALTKALDKPWGEIYLGLCIQGYIASDLPSSNHVWGLYLKNNGFERNFISDDTYTIEDFCKDHPEGTYVLGTGSHAVTVCSGKYFDAWESGKEIVIYYWKRKED